MSVSLVVSQINELDDYKLSVDLELNGHENDDIQALWGRLGLTYAKQLLDFMVVEPLPHIETHPVSITFMNGQEALSQSEENDPDYDWSKEEENAFEAAQEDLSDHSIGWSLDAFDSSDIIGGYSTPTVALATKIEKYLDIARSKVKFNTVNDVEASQ